MAPHSLKDRVQQQQLKQKCQHDQHAKPRAYEQGDLVFIRDFRRQASSPWSPGTIVQGNPIRLNFLMARWCKDMLITFVNTQLLFTTSLPLNSETDQEVSEFSGNDEGLVELLLPVP